MCVPKFYIYVANTNAVIVQIGLSAFQKCALRGNFHFFFLIVIQGEVKKILLQFIIFWFSFFLISFHSLILFLVFFNFHIKEFNYFLPQSVLIVCLCALLKFHDDEVEVDTVF